MVKSVRLCRTEPAIFKEDIIMSKIVNEAKIGHLRSGLLPLLPDIHCLHRRRFSACVKIDKAKVDFCADFEYDIGTKVWWYQW